jgi:hypothetical protein
VARTQEIEQVWHNDGHRIILRINRAELEVLEVICPHETGSGPCKDRKNECVVRLFIYRFGMDCNGGVCPPSQELPICWTISGDIDDMDSSQVWFMPLTDEIFTAWMVSNGLDPNPPSLNS